MYVYMARGKHDTPVYASAVAVVQAHISDVYLYEDDDELVARAERIVADRAEADAWALLQERKDYEYEDVRRVKVIE